MRWKDVCNMDISPDEPVVLPRIEAAKRQANKKAGVHEPYKYWRISVSETQLVAIKELWDTWTSESKHEKCVDRLIAAMSDYHARHLNA